MAVVNMHGNAHDDGDTGGAGATSTVRGGHRGHRPRCSLARPSSWAHAPRASSSDRRSAIILLTSGTTGTPKGVMLTHDMLTRTAFGSAYARAFEDGRRIIFSLPMYHVFGYSEGLLAAMWAGGAIIPYLRFDAAEMLDGIERHRASDALWIPTMSLALLDALPGKARDLSSLTAVLASGGRAPERLWQALRI